MKLAAKLIGVTLFAMAMLTLLVGWIATKREWSLLEKEREAIARKMANISRDELIASWRREGDDGPSKFLNSRSVQTSSVKVRWRWFNNQETRSAMGQSHEEILEAVSVGQTVTVIQQQPSGRVHTYVPIINERTRLGGLDITDSSDSISSRIATIWWTTVGSIFSLFLVSGLIVAWVGMRLIGRPLAKLVEKTERVAAGDFSTPVVLKGRDELKLLADSLNEMASKLSQQQKTISQETQSKIEALNQLRHNDRLQTVGQLSSGIAHELGTPLNVVLGHADLIASGKISNDEVTESAETIQSEIKRMTGIVKQLVDFSRRAPSLKSRVDLDTLLRSSIELLHSVSYKVNVNLLLDTSEEHATIDANEEQLKQVLINLIMNAIQSMPDGGNVNIKLQRSEQLPPSSSDVEADRNGYFRVSIQDHGEGIEAANLKRIFEPFFTTKDVGAGTGLGLSISYGIVTEHQGWIAVESTPGNGSRFDVYLPALS